MERMLLKMARQLNEYDEASLTALWEKYATIVERFEPSKRWEEAAIVFSLIQAVRLKNQLFNQHLAVSLELPKDKTLPGLDKAMAWMSQKQKGAQEEAAGETPPPGRAQPSAASAKSKARPRRTVLSFRERKGNKPE